MSQALTALFKTLSDAELSAFARYEQGRADELQRKAATSQREAAAARKEIKRRGKDGPIPYELTEAGIVANKNPTHR